ncbi:MAG: response regulator [Candidatus Omnitrophica bacterium]|nr:response regulator [Candidatus Omnitrophota bacterium]
MSKNKILVVDDEEDMLDFLELRLAANGYSVVTANNGNDAIRLAKEERPDLILLDIMMPGLDGSEVAGILKDNPETKSIPIVFLTCLYAKEEEKKQGHTIHGNFFVAKPFDQNELLSEIKRQIDKK